MTARRISEHYRRHLPAIALIYVGAGRNKAETVRQVKAQFSHLSSFKAGRLDAWAGNAEWKSALTSAEEQASVGRELPPEARGAKLLTFAKDALAQIEEAHKKAKEEGDEKQKKELEARLLKIHDALRSEERHQENLKTQAKLRDFSAFAANVLALSIECATVAEYEAKLREAVKDPAKLMGVTIGE